MNGCYILNKHQEPFKKRKEIKLLYKEEDNTLKTPTIEI